MHSKKNVVYLIHSVIYLLQTTEVHRHTHKTYNIYRKKNTQRETDRKKQNTLNRPKSLSLQSITFSPYIKCGLQFAFTRHCNTDSQKY